MIMQPGDTVQYSDEGLKSIQPVKPTRTGVVSGIKRGMIYVVWAGNMTPRPYAAKFIQIVDE